ncbi:glycosyl transferase, partial [Staphylococcus haemolyticus]
NSTNEALLMDVPLLAFPQNADQPLVAQQIENINVGQQLNSATVTTENLKAKVVDMLQNRATYQAQIKKIKQTQALDQPGYVTAVDQILTFRDHHINH